MTTGPSAPHSPGGTRPPERPRDPRRPFAGSPFTQLARTHVFGIAGDAFFAIALAGSVFFSLDFNAARWSVAVYLLLTIAPFAVAAPLIGPALDRIPGGRKWVIVGGMFLRAVLCFFVIRHLDSLLFYPEAFLMLVLGKTYTISKSAVVPTTVRSDEELVEANSKLTVISALAVVVAAPIAALLLKLGGPGWALALGLISFAIATVVALQLPQVAVATEPAGEVEKQELRSAGILLAASAMGLVRGIVGFVAFMLAFDFKNDDAPLWHLGFVAAAAQLGFFLGAVIAPRVRRYTTEERMLIGTLVVMVAGGLVTAATGGLAAAAVISLLIGAASSAAKQAFDAIVQRDAPDANRGRSFARFETRFQLLWVIGALVPILVPIPAELGYLMVGAVAAFAVISYIIGLSRIRRGPDTLSPDAPPVDPSLDDPTVAAPSPAAANPSARRWARGARKGPSPPDWEPPPGFVAQRLGDEPASGDRPPPPPPPPPAPVEDPTTESDSGAGVEQPQLPLDDLDATTTMPAAEPTHVYPEPPWRNAGDSAS